ncbi:hypothetical protein DRO54_06940 [Candidatus Bathyarchaeota archaeon]|nr:MAG: hypothetical protein DRO54_06940 [Candidatus Bathyarchaeota archaeon]
MKICDAHVHLGESGPWQPYMNPTIKIEELIKIFKEFNVEKAVVFPNPNVGDKYPKMNDYIAECVRKYPNLLVGFGRVDPRRGEEAIKELVRIKENLKLRGLKLHPMVECFRPDHPYFDKLFKKANELGIPIIFHTGSNFSSPSLALKVAKKYPKLTVILGHLREGCVHALNQADNIYVETSGGLPDYVEMAVDIDENRILFGSDTPYLRYKTQIAIIEAANITEKTKRKIFKENFLRLFKS